MYLEARMNKGFDGSRWLVILLVAAIAALLLPTEKIFPGRGDEAETAGETVAEAKKTNDDDNEKPQKSATEEVEYKIDGRHVLVSVGDRERNILTASGSGVVYAVSADMLWIVTAGHVLERGDDDTVWVDFGDEEGRDACVTCEECRISGNADLAFLGLRLDDIPGGIRRRLALPRTDKNRYDALRQGDRICVWGYAEDKLIQCEGVLTEAWIYVEDFGQCMMTADCETEPGMSGGGMYDEEGNLIGIVCGRNEEGEIAAAPLHVAQAEAANMTE